MVVADIRRNAGAGAHRVEGFQLDFQVEEVGIRVRRRPAGLPGIGGDDIEDAIAVGEGEILIEDGVGEREHGRIYADAEGEGSDSDGRESGVL